MESEDSRACDSQTSLKRVTIVTDGACCKNPGPGGWACLLKYRGTEKILSGGAPETTNNRMEMLAAIEGLKALKHTCSVLVITDSQYLLQGITEWVPGWRRKNWKTRGGDDVKNRDLWQDLDALCKTHNVEWKWVKGHDIHEDNNRVDGIARAEAERVRDAQTRTQSR